MKNKLIYSILFLKGKEGVTIKEIANLLQMKEIEATRKVDSLKRELIDYDWPLEVKKNESRIRLTVNKETSFNLSKTMKKTIDVNLTKSLLEVVTIIAYRQPVTKSEIEKIRGLSADYCVSKLLEYELIESNGYAETVGHPKLYVTTSRFLELFDLLSLDELPEKPEEVAENIDQEENLNLFSYDDDEESSEIKGDEQ